MSPRQEQATDLFRAFADVTRLRIMSLLVEEKELCVCDLCAVLGEVQPKVSRHLAILRGVDLVEVRREGKWKYYALADPPSPLHRTLVRWVGRCQGDIDELAEDRARLRGLELRVRCR